MVVPTHLPGAAWLKWLRNLPLRIGVLTGFYLTVVMVAGLLIANRLPELETFADLRNWTCGSLFILIGLIPVATFRRRPWSLFTSAASGWLLFSLAYWVAGIYFDHLHTRLNKTPFHVFLLGLGSYAVVSVAIWVMDMTRDVLEHGIAHPHHHRPGAVRHHE